MPDFLLLNGQVLWDRVTRPRRDVFQRGHAKSHLKPTQYSLDINPGA